MKDPIAWHNVFGIQGLNIAWYGVFICIGLIGGVLVGRMLAKKRKYSFDLVLDMIIISLPFAIVGARVYYVAFEWESYQGDFLEMISFWHGGMAIYGAVIGAVIALLIFSKWKKVKMGDLLDIAAPGLILGQAIGRWGNFANQEAFGSMITNASSQWFPFGVQITKSHKVLMNLDGVFGWHNCPCMDASSPFYSNGWHLATFFYESMWNLLVFALLLWYFKKAKHKGNVFAMYLVLYGTGRFFIEGLRLDSLWLIQDVIRVSQALSLLLVVGGLIYLLVMHRRPIKPYEYTGKYSLVPAPAEGEIPKKQTAIDEVFNQQQEKKQANAKEKEE